MKANDPAFGDKRFLAGVELIGRTGATSFQIRYSDDDPPTVWLAVAQHGDHHEADAALDPITAVMRLAERLIDGGKCTHCGRTSGFSGAFDELPDLVPSVCWYSYDPELETFRRSCEGDAP